MNSITFSTNGHASHKHHNGTSHKHNGIQAAEPTNGVQGSARNGLDDVDQP